MGFVIDDSRPDLGGNIRHGDLYTWAPQLWAFFIDRFAIRSMLDVGCGEGHAVRFFSKNGVYAHGIDGLFANVARAVVPIAQHDLTVSPYVMPVDFVWSCEVAEHIAEDRVGYYISTICNGRIVAMTHALPGQGGYHHVNCKPPQYWIGLMEKNGYELDPNNAEYVKIASSGPHFNYFQTSGMVFHRR